MPRINLKAGRNMTPVSAKAKMGAAGRLLKLIFKYHPISFAFVVLFVLVNSYAGVLGSRFVGTVLVSQFIEPSLKVWDGTIHSLEWNGITVTFEIAILAMVLIYAASIVCNYLANILMSIIGQDVQMKIRNQLFNKLQTLPVSYFDRRGHGDIMSVFTNDVDALREMIARSLPMAVMSLTSMISCFVMMITTDLLLTGVVVCFAALVLFITAILSGKARKTFVAMQMELGKTNGYIEEMTSGQKVVKVFNFEERNVEGFEKHNEEFFQQAVKGNRFASILMPTVNQLGNLQYAILALVGGLFIVNNLQGASLTGLHVYDVGIIVSFLLYSKSFTQPIGQISQQLASIVIALAGATRIFEVIDTPAEADNGYVELVNAKEDEEGNPVECNEVTGKWAWKHPHTDGSQTTYVWLRGYITMDDVDFGYIPGKTVLKHVSLWAKPGQKVAFVGPTGAGKTTITNLFNRFYDIEDGKIRFDGININKIKKADLRRSLGMVLQDSKLFTGTVRDNIRFGKLDATEEEIVEAAKLANAHDFITKLPKGYDTILENAGAGLSQGQRQLLSIARCAINNPPVMILDEATSSIDSRTERLVQEGMDAIMKGRTVFVIAHRLSTIMNSDAIMVLQKGEIIERGTHDQLMELKGKYYQLYTGKTE